MLAAVIESEGCVNYSGQFCWHEGIHSSSHLQMEFGRRENFQNLRGGAYQQYAQEGASSFKSLFQPYLARIWVQPAALNPNIRLEQMWRTLEIMVFPLGCKHLQTVQVNDFILAYLFFNWLCLTVKQWERRKRIRERRGIDWVLQHAARKKLGKKRSWFLVSEDYCSSV